MSIIKSVQTFLSGYSGMEIVPIQTDLTKKDSTSYALSPSGNAKIKQDILGNRTHQNSYVFYAKEAAADEVDRQGNYDFLEGLSEWIEKQNDAKNFPSLPSGYEVESLEVSNAMQFDTDEKGTALYQVQIQMTYNKEAIL